MGKNFEVDDPQKLWEEEQFEEFGPTDRLVTAGEALRRLKEGAFGSFQLAWEWLWNEALVENKIYSLPMIQQVAYRDKDSANDWILCREFDFNSGTERPNIYFLKEWGGSQSDIYFIKNGLLTVTSWISSDVFALLDEPALRYLNECGIDTESERDFIVLTDDIRFSDQGIAKYSGENDGREFVDIKPRTNKTEKARNLGRPRAIDWDSALIHLIGIANRPDGLPDGPGTQAKIEAMIFQFFIDQGLKVPEATSDVRRYAQRIMDAISPR